jgi:hypothetical protein
VPGNVPEKLRQGYENARGPAVIVASSFRSDLDLSAHKLRSCDKLVVQIVVNGLIGLSRL